MGDKERCAECRGLLGGVRMCLDEEASVCWPCWTAYPQVFKDHGQRMCIRIAKLEVRLASMQGCEVCERRCSIKGCDERGCTSEVRDTNDEWHLVCDEHVVPFQEGGDRRRLSVDELGD